MTVICDRRQSPMRAFQARWALSCGNEGCREAINHLVTRSRADDDVLARPATAPHRQQWSREARIGEKQSTQNARHAYKSPCCGVFFQSAEFKFSFLLGDELFAVVGD